MRILVTADLSEDISDSRCHWGYWWEQVSMRILVTVDFNKDIANRFPWRYWWQHVFNVEINDSRIQWWYYWQQVSTLILATTDHTEVISDNSLFCLMTPLEHIDFHIIGYWPSSMWSLWHISLEETCWCHIGYSFQYTARDLLYALSHRQDSMMVQHDGTVVDHWSEWKITQNTNAPTMQEDPNLYSSVLYCLSYAPSLAIFGITRNGRSEEDQLSAVEIYPA